jgi:hypothetical protein
VQLQKKETAGSLACTQEIRDLLGYSGELRSASCRFHFCETLLPRIARSIPHSIVLCFLALMSYLPRFNISVKGSTSRLPDAQKLRTLER